MTLVPPGTKRYGCICVRQKGRVVRNPESPSGFDWNIDPECRYHRLAAEYPDDHSIPWNCPTFFDGCNCEVGAITEDKT